MAEPHDGKILGSWHQSVSIVLRSHSSGFLHEWEMQFYVKQISLADKLIFLEPVESVMLIPTPPFFCSCWTGPLSSPSDHIL